MNNNRYIRQSILQEIGIQGQQNLLKSSVAIIGCGGLGSVAAPYLAGAGIGQIILIDGDAADVSNLHRQVFFSEKSQGISKALLLEKHIQELNPEIEVSAHSQMLNKENIHELIGHVDVVLECTDTIFTKYLVNDFCHMLSIPMIYGAIHKFDGYVSCFENTSHKSIHLRDIFPEPDTEIPNCSEVGVLGPIAGLTGILQANEAIKFLSGAGDNLIGKLLTYNILNNDQMTLKLKKVFKENITELFQQNSYASPTCDIKGISQENVSSNRTDYEVISILETNENILFDEDTLHIALSTFDIDNWQYDKEKKYVFHCKSGRRSQALITKLQEAGKQGNFYYLLQD